MSTTPQNDHHEQVNLDQLFTTLETHPINSTITTITNDIQSFPLSISDGLNTFTIPFDSSDTIEAVKMKIYAHYNYDEVFNLTNIRLYETYQSSDPLHNDTTTLSNANITHQSILFIFNSTIKISLTFKHVFTKNRPNREPHTLEFSPCDLISELSTERMKYKYIEFNDIDEQRYISNGRDLYFEKSIREMGVRHDNTVFVVLRITD